MTRDWEAQAALLRLARALESNPNVKSVHAESADGDWYAWVVVADRSWEREPAVIQAHVMEDPDFALSLRVTDRADQVPEGAERVTGRTAAL